MNEQTYVVAACRNAPLIHDRNFPVKVIALDAASRIDALRLAKAAFAADQPIEPWTHLRIVDGPSEVES